MIRRTTVAAEQDDLATLQDEARRRGESLAQLLRQIIAEKAEELRAERRPRFGIGHSRSGASTESVEDEESPASTPYEG